MSSDGTPSTAIGDIYIPDMTDASKLKVKFAAGKSGEKFKLNKVYYILSIFSEGRLGAQFPLIVAKGY